MFKNIVFYFFLLSLLIPNVILSFTEQLTPLGAITNVVLPGGVIYLLLSLSPRLGRSMWLMFPIIFLAAFQIVLIDLYGRSIIAVDMFLNLVTTNTSEVAELLGNMLPIILIVVAIYVPSLIIATVFIRKKVRLTPRFLKANFRVASVLCIIGVGMLVCAFRSPVRYSTTDDLYPVNVGYNLYLAVDRTMRTADYHDTSSSFSYGAKSTRPESEREIYLLVIGETSRAENWHLLGYKRNTTPRLSSRHDIIAASKAYSESNTTHKSVPMLLSPVDATNFDKEIYNVKSLVTAFKEAGYSTAFLSNQRHNHSFIDFFAAESDTVVFIKETDGNTGLADVNRKPDSDLLPVLDAIIARGNTKQLVVLHTYGSHFNYVDRYSDEDRHFNPCDYGEANPHNRESLINAYDNTIVATDRFLTECICRLEDIQGVRAGLLYCSDHGEDIFDDGSRNFLHASPRPSLRQVHVPFIAWLSKCYRECEPDKCSCINLNMDRLVSSSRSFMPTALDMAGIVVKDDALVDTEASLFSPTYKGRRPLYLSDHNVAVRLRDIVI